MNPNLTEKDIARFWGHVSKDGPPHPYDASLGNCWIWKRGVKRYGYFKASGRYWTASRIVYELTFGGIPDGKCVCHSCDRGRCVNPSHLFPGTHLENMQDRERKGRGNQPSGDACGARKHPERLVRGERQWCAKLKPDDVREIRARRARGETLVSIASSFGITYGQVSRIYLRRKWAHIP
jgi:hypothetical protein